MSDYPEQVFRWCWRFRAPPEALWPLVSNTDRFNRDAGYPAVSAPAEPGAKGRATHTRRLRAQVFGQSIEWDEHAFEWVAPRRFGVERIFLRGPVARLQMTCELSPVESGTDLTYELRIVPASWAGRLILPFAIGQKARATTERIFRRYDEYAVRGLRASQLARAPKLSASAETRLGTIARALTTEAGQRPALVEKMQTFLRDSDDLSVARIRAYAIADEWGEPRREVLHLFLHGTRAGLLDFSWDLVCPHCRGAKVTHPTLNTVTAHAHCDSCDIEFTANFDQSVELTFRPNAAVRAVARTDYCVGGPQITPHVVAQQRLTPGETRRVPLALRPGRYRVRVSGWPVQYAFRVAPDAPAEARIDLGRPSLGEPAVAPTGELALVSRAGNVAVAVVEHLAWSDQATTAAEVTSLQLFRDLFSREVLRPGEQISVGSMTVVFTDLKNSTRMYQEIGDAPAFGRVLTHFEILKAAVAAEGGAIVKTMGDAIMAVFPRPIPAVRAMIHAQRWLAHPDEHSLPPEVNVPPSSLKPLALKAGIHAGPCLAISQNERLDYFGTTVNLTARLCGLCSGVDLVLSDAVHADGEVGTWLEETTIIRATAEHVALRGFGDASFKVWRVARTADSSQR